MLSAFYDDGEFYVYDTGFRLQGEAPHIIMKAVHGFDQREMLIRFALTGSEGHFDINEDDPFMRNKWAATLWILLRKGKIKSITGLSGLERDSRVIANMQRLNVGDEILDSWIGTEKQVLTRLYFICETKAELAKAMKEYMNRISVKDEMGKELVLSGFDIERALSL